MPVLGVTQLRTRAQEATLQLVEEFYTRMPELGRDTDPARTKESGTGAGAEEADSAEI